MLDSLQLFGRVKNFHVDIARLRRFHKQIVCNTTSIPYHDHGTHYVGWALTSRDGSISDGVQRLPRTKESVASVRGGMIETSLCVGPAKEALDLLSDLGLKHFRARIMALRNEGAAMKFHRDADKPAWRVHVPIITNPASVFEWKLEDGRIEQLHMPADGSAWLVRVDVPHRAINESTQASERVHLIASLDGSPSPGDFDGLAMPRNPNSHSMPTTSSDLQTLEDAVSVTHVQDRYELLKLLPRSGVVCEVGVYKGDFSEHIYKVTRPSKLHLIDPWIHQDLRLWENTTSEEHFGFMRNVQRRFANEILQRRVILHQGFSVDILSCFPPAYFDWVYLDGDHRYETVRLELELCDSRVKPSGLILGHDYIRPDLYPDERKSQFQVVQAVADFCSTHNWRVVLQTPDQPPGSKQCPTFVLARNGWPPHTIG